MAKAATAGRVWLAAGLVVGAGAAAAVVAASSVKGSHGDEPGIWNGWTADTSAAATTTTDPEGIDHNCDLPGSGFPWLRQDTSFTVAFTTSTVFASTVPDVPAWAGFLPVPVLADGTAQSMDDVYRRLCEVHPDLGGAGLSRVSAAQAKALICGGMDECHDRSCDDFPPDLYTDDRVRADAEGRMCLEPVRMYWLPPIPPALLEALSNEPDTTSTTVPSETQSWEVLLIGSEVQDYQRFGLRLRGWRMAAYFTYEISGEFTLKKTNDRWMFDTGRITDQAITAREVFGPPEMWERTTSFCTNCGDLQALSELRGTVAGNELVLNWGPITPVLQASGLYRPCVPSGACESQVAEVRLRGNRFIKAANGFVLQLDGPSYQASLESSELEITVYLGRSDSP